MFGAIRRLFAPLFHRAPRAPSAPTAPSAPASNPVADSTPVRSHHGESGFDPASGLRVNYSLANATPAQRRKVEQAVTVLTKVINDPAFREAVRTHPTFSKNQGMTSEQILKKILSGAEDRHPEVDHEIDLTLTLGTLRGDVVGQTNAGIDEITLNRLFLDSPDYTVAELANTLMHEWIHKIGFEDKSRWWPRADRAAATYRIGALVEKHAKQAA